MSQLVDVTQAYYKIDKSQGPLGTTITMTKISPLVNVNNINSITMYDELSGLQWNCTNIVKSDPTVTFDLPTSTPGGLLSNLVAILVYETGFTNPPRAGIFLLSNPGPQSFDVLPTTVLPGDNVLVTETTTPASLDINTLNVVTPTPTVILRSVGNPDITVPFNTTSTTLSFNAPTPSTFPTTYDIIPIVPTFIDGVLNNFYMSFGTFTVNASPVICFKKDSKILCLKDDIEKEIYIQDLKIGDLVKTINNGFLPVKILAKSFIQNSENKERILKKLYKLSKSKYPELNEDLYLTGCHSILVDKITDIQKEKIENILGVVYVTDSKYRLLVSVDERAEPFIDNSVSIIYHIAIGDDKNRNYGIYANGLLVETCFENSITKKMKEFEYII
jgi:hypothetical protein